MKKNLIIISLIAALIFSCKEEKIEPFSMYNIDSTAIGKSVTIDSLKISFNPPLNWEESVAELSSKKVIDYKDSRINPEDYKFIPSKIFFDKSYRSVLNLGKVAINKNDFVKEEVIKKIVEISTSRYPTIEKQYDDFNLNGISFTRVRFDYANWSATKVFFQNKTGDIIQLEYTIQNEFIVDQIPLIESSIGTIKLK